MTWNPSHLALCLLFAGGLSACAKQSTTSSPAASEAAQRMPSTGCGQSDARADYGGIQRGSVVRLHPHSPWEDEVNWSEDMGHYVDRVSRVTALAGVDAVGCPGVYVEADAGVFFWRARDLELLGQAPDDRCGQNDLNADYAGIGLGVEVAIQKHRDWFGDLNWDAGMDEKVGQRALVTGFAGVDKAGCPGVTLDVDEGVYFWRVRDLALQASPQR